MTDASSAPLAPRLLLACPCLNVKMHLAAEPSEELQAIAGNEVQLGLAGVSVVRKEYLLTHALGPFLSHHLQGENHGRSDLVTFDPSRLTTFCLVPCHDSLGLSFVDSLLGAKNPLLSSGRGQTGNRPLHQLL